MNLSKYYLTPHWKKRSAEFRKTKGKCERCGTTERLQVHHKLYKFYREKDSDLECLCETCHLKGVHQQKGEMDLIDFNHTKTRGDRLNELIDNALTANVEKPRDYLGASRLGHECKRALQLEFFNTPKDEGKGFTGRTLRIFQVGHIMENMAAEWLRAAGLNLKTVGKDGKQFGFVTGKGKIKGHCDGIIIDGPKDFGPFPRLWEHKTASDKKWKEFVKNKVKKANITYYAQIIIYMAYMELADNPALFMVTNKDTQELYFEDVLFDASYAQEISDRGANIIQACLAGELLPREWPSEDYFQCKFCSWSNRCWHG
jgi:hypothetical protein